MQKIQAPKRLVAAIVTALSVTAMPFATAHAATLNAAAGGTFTFNYDHAALEEYVFGTANSGAGFILTKFWNTADSDYLTKSAAFFQTDNDFTPDTSDAFAHDIMPVGTNPTGQASGRAVKATTANFSVNSDTLTGVTSSTLGITGVQGFRIPFYGDGSSGLFYGDFGIRYNQAARQAAWDENSLTGTASGWYVHNYISLSAVAYDLANLSVEFTDANNWKMSGDLLMGPENALGLLLGTPLKDVGNFCLGVGSFSGCSNPVATSAVPVPAAAWLFGSALTGLLGLSRRRKNG